MATGQADGELIDFMGQVRARIARDTGAQLAPRLEARGEASRSAGDGAGCLRRWLCGLGWLGGDGSVSTTALQGSPVVDRARRPRAGVLAPRRRSWILASPRGIGARQGGSLLAHPGDAGDHPVLDRRRIAGPRACPTSVRERGALALHVPSAGRSHDPGGE